MTSASDHCVADNGMMVSGLASPSSPQEAIPGLGARRVGFRKRPLWASWQAGSVLLAMVGVVGGMYWAHAPTAPGVTGHDPSPERRAPTALSVISAEGLVPEVEVFHASAGFGADSNPDPDSSGLPSPSSVTPLPFREPAHDAVAPEPAAAPEVASSVQITRMAQRPIGDARDIDAAFRAYMAGEVATAARLYRKVLLADPANLDALLGQAALAVRQGDTALAVRHYTQVLDIEPRHLVAQAALLLLSGQEDFAGSVAGVQQLIARHPEAAILYATLGDLYASRFLWSPAREAYTAACHAAPETPEHAFRLATVLERLNQAGPALQHYRHALDLLGRVPATLRRADIEARIARLGG